MSYLCTDDVSLRGVALEDMEAFKRWWNNSSATRYMETGWRPATNKVANDFFDGATNSDTDLVFTIVNRKTDDAIGTCGLYQIFWPGRRAEFRIFIGENSYHNKGLGTQAGNLLLQYGFLKANMEVIHLGVNASNLGALNSYKKLGFVQEGVRRRYVYSWGEYHDAIMMSILREEYLSANSNLLD